MSEYAHRRISAKTPPQTETLFDDDTFSKIDHIVDTRGESYDQARRLLNIDAPHYETPEAAAPRDPSEGVSVRLGTRAIALANIMATYNQLSSTMGVRKYRQYADNDFDARYERPEIVVENMGMKASVMIHRNEKDFEDITATKELIEAGFEPNAVAYQERRLKIDLNNMYGPGNTKAPARHKLITTARRAAGEEKKPIKAKKAS